MVEQAVEDASRVAEIAIDHARKSGFSPILAQVVSIERDPDENWDVTVEVALGARRFRAKIDHLKGTVTEWSEVGK